MSRPSEEVINLSASISDVLASGREMTMYDLQHKLKIFDNRIFKNAITRLSARGMIDVFYIRKVAVYRRAQ